ncbi:MAG: hypothetical protein K6B75_00475 [Lachnospiraceae bacterium]|nr:hypothetical protein [Lachnospiraceae bacterium]
MEGSKANKVISVAVLFVTVLFLLFSGFYITEHADHECNHDHCPVCEMIEVCSMILKITGTGIVFAAVYIGLHTEFFLRTVTYILCLTEDSLIARKVRLND